VIHFADGRIADTRINQRRVKPAEVSW
jgi:hypothetical protein